MERISIAINSISFIAFFVASDYYEIFENPDDELYDLCRYLIYMVRCESGEQECFAKATIGKYIDEMDIPLAKRKYK